MQAQKKNLSCQRAPAARADESSTGQALQYEIMAQDMWVYRRRMVTRA